MVQKVSILLCFLFFIFGCEEKEKQPDTGTLSINFKHTVDNDLLKFDTLLYVNKAGNHYLVDNIQYFISHVELVRADGAKINIQSSPIHYVDTDIPATQQWNITDALPEGNYTGINFIFGLLPADNQDYKFVNPPESMMFWPSNLGGGYHAMKLNGKWQRNDSLINLNIHIGRGKTGGDVFVDNYCTIKIAHSFNIHADSQASLILDMNVNKWFESPNTYDFNAYGSGIMENQEAMRKICENGVYVFSCK